MGLLSLGSMANAVHGLRLPFVFMYIALQADLHHTIIILLTTFSLHDRRQRRVVTSEHFYQGGGREKAGPIGNVSGRLDFRGHGRG